MSAPHPDDPPEMPKDWWPDTINIRGRDGDTEWGFTVSGDELKLAKLDLLNDRINVLREALWMAKHL